MRHLALAARRIRDAVAPGEPARQPPAAANRRPGSHAEGAHGETLSRLRRGGHHGRQLGPAPRRDGGKGNRGGGESPGRRREGTVTQLETVAVALGESSFDIVVRNNGLARAGELRAPIPTKLRGGRLKKE